jgi:hypothetical protein
MQFTDSTSDTEDDSKVSRIRFATRDFLELMETATGDTDLRRIQIERDTVLADADGPLAESDFLAETLILVNGDGEDVVETDAIVQAALAVTELGTTLANAGSAISDDADGDGHTKRKDVLLQGSTWTLDSNDDAGDVDVPDTDDQIELDLIGLTTATSKRKFDGDTDQGLFFSNRNAKITGGMHIDSGVLDTDADVDGVVTGTAKVSADKIVEAAL